MRLEVDQEQIVLTRSPKVPNPTEELFGSVKKKKLYAVKAIREFRKAGGRS